MDYSDLLFELRDGVAVLTLNRPEAMNAFSGRMGEELGHAYARCDEDDAVRAIVLTGAGSAFCVGADMSAGADTFAGQQGNATFSASPVSPRPWTLRKPVIAAMNGHAVGLGLTLALQCDFRIAADEGKYGILQVRRGVMPDAQSRFTLPRIVGSERAAYLMLTGRKLTGSEAAAMGLVLCSVPAASVLETALEIARDIAVNAAPLSVAITKRLLWQSPELDAEEVERFETELHQILLGRSDAMEGVVAYLERRTPKWNSSPTRDWPTWPIRSFDTPGE